MVKAKCGVIFVISANLATPSFQFNQLDFPFVTSALLRRIVLVSVVNECRLTFDRAVFGLFSG